MGCAIAVVLAGATAAAAQQRPASDSARCDSVVAASRVDSVSTGLFILAARRDDGAFDADVAQRVALIVGASFEPPHPFRLTVFSGAPRLRLLRAASDTLPELRPPTLTGVYRLQSGKTGRITKVAIARASLMPGFDSAAVAAIRTAGVVDSVFLPAAGEDSMVIDVRFATDSLPGARRMVSADFPRMPVVDAVPRSDNPPPVFPEEAKADSVASGDIVLRFVVDRTGSPVFETIELVRGTSLAFLRAALLALPSQRFTPASIRGCAVSQAVEYAFTFLRPGVPPRH